MTSFYERRIVPRLIACACAAPAIMKQRAKIVPLAEGRVLELGIGGGLNLAFYDPRQVTSIQGVDPSEGLRDQARAAPRALGLEVEVTAGRAEALPFEDDAFDTLVCTFTLCSVHSPGAALEEARRVLKPGGRFLFCEHGLAPDPGVARWQRWIEPVWKPLGGGCHLTRPVAAAVAKSGFTIDWVETMYLPGAPRVFGWNEWGVARVR
jgi:SAM-dependent methyltransferase